MHNTRNTIVQYQKYLKSIYELPQFLYITYNDFHYFSELYAQYVGHYVNYLRKTERKNRVVSMYLQR